MLYRAAELPWLACFIGSNAYVSERTVIAPAPNSGTMRVFFWRCIAQILRVIEPWVFLNRLRYRSLCRVGLTFSFVGSFSLVLGARRDRRPRRPHGIISTVAARLEATTATTTATVSVTKPTPLAHKHLMNINAYGRVTFSLVPLLPLVIISAGALSMNIDVRSSCISRGA